MSELIDNSQQRKALLKHLILQLHEGQAPEAVKSRLAEKPQDYPLSSASGSFVVDSCIFELQGLKPLKRK